jgi:DNA-binding CsgD family transcriptional regulator
MAVLAGDDTAKLLDAVYDAALDATKWEVFLGQLGRSFPGALCTLVLHDPIARTGILVPSPGWDPSHIANYNQHFASINPWLRNLHKRPVGLVFPSELMWPVEDLRRSEFYSDWVLPQGIRSGAGVTIMQDGNRFMAVSMLFAGRSEERKSLASSALQGLVSHLCRAARIGRQLAASDFRWQAAEQALNRLTVGVVLVDEALSVVFSNRSADALVAKADGIGIGQSGRLAFADPVAADRLARLIRHPEAGDNGILAVRRPSGARPFAVLVAPLRPRADSQDPTRPTELKAASAILFIKDPSAIQRIRDDTIAKVFDLSRAEARLVTSLLDGHHLEEAARRLGISRNTAKTQLKNVFAKLECTRQSELVRIVTDGIPQIIE